MTDQPAYTDADVRVALAAFTAACATSPTAAVDSCRAIAHALAAVAPAIAARALREESERTYTHTMKSQSGERTQSQRPIWTHGDRAILLKRADEIEAGR